MSDELKKKIDTVKESFKEFTNFIELKDFRTYLLFTLTGQVPSNILAQMGLGGSKETISLPYNPIFKIYYQKINLFSAGSLIIYLKSEPITDEFLLEKDDPIFKEYLNPDEMSLAFRGKEKFLFPKISDCSSLETDTMNIKVDDLFHSLESFMAVTEPNILFVLHGKTDSDPDLIFAFNMMPEMASILNKNVLKVDVFFDSDHKTKNITYLKREEDYSLKFLENIQDVSHADLYKSAFSYILHIESFNKPF
jgi:hypothetical protein